MSFTFDNYFDNYEMSDLKTPASPMDRTNDGYDHLEKMIKSSFSDAIANREILFTTNCENLYDIFLLNLPEDARQHYNCNACRNFVNRYGGLVTIDNDGYIYPVMWSGGFTWPAFFYKSISAVVDMINRSKVNGVFVTSDRRLGMPKTGIWTHMSVDIPRWMIYNNRIKTSEQYAAEMKEEFRMLMAAANKYDIDTIETAVNMLRSDSLYRGEKFVGMAEWFLDLKKTLKTIGSRNYANVVWKAAVTAPNGFCHISSSMIGTLLDDIQDGFDFNSIKQRFNEKMNPLQYQRPQSAPGAGNIKRAEEIVAKLDLADSLQRRFARLDEIKTVWTPQRENSDMQSIGIFSGLKTKNEPIKKSYDDSIPTTTITWEKFNRTVLPTAKKIEMQVSYGRDSYTAIVGPGDYTATPIILWDKEEERNPYSWYTYHNGSYAKDWNLTPGRYVDVTGITLRPNMWQEGYEHIGKAVIFILKGCKDNQKPTLCLFPELLRTELKEVRSTIEAYSRENYISGYEQASACGIMLSEGRGGYRTWDRILRVTTDVGVRKYKLDRWD